jgi:hypothetical protein
MAGSGMADEEPISDADADALVAEAVRKRAEQQSGRLMRRRLRPVAGGAVAGLLLAAAGGRFLGLPLARIGGHSLGPVVAILAVSLGVLVLAYTELLLLRALDVSPATQWGDPVAESCPACGENSLREDRVAVAEANGIVALCTPECGYADIRTDPVARQNLGADDGIVLVGSNPMSLG